MKRVGPALGFGLAAVALLAAALLLPGRLNPLEPQAEATVRAAAALLEAHSVSGRLSRLRSQPQGHPGRGG